MLISIIINFCNEKDDIIFLKNSHNLSRLLDKCQFFRYARHMKNKQCRWFCIVFSSVGNFAMLLNPEPIMNL